MSASAAAPVAADDTAFVAEDSVVDVNVLANDTDANEISTFTQGANGAVSVVTVADVQRLRYDSNLNFNGTDTFTYTASDGTNTSNTATVTVTVTEVNDQPTADQESGTTNEDTPVDFAFSFLLTGDSPGPNESGQTLTITSVTQGAGGTATLGASAITFTPTPNFNGPAHFFYTVTDNGTTNGNPDPKTRTARVNVTVNSVNDAPVAVDDSYTVNEDTVLTVAAPGVLGNDTDESAAAMTATKTSNPAGGAVTLNSNGSFTFTPNTNVNGTQSFTYTVFDGTLTSNTATVTITVVAVNDPPSATADARTTPEDVPLTLTSSNLTANDSKGPANEGTQTLTVTAVSAPENGTVSLVDGTATFTPAADFHGTARFTYTVTDNGTTNGVADPKSASAQVVITVTDVNDVPTAAADEKTTNEDTAVSFPAGDLLVNDLPGPFNESAQTLTLTAVGSPVNGTVSLDGGTITFTPDPDFFGAASFGYTIVDNGTSNGAADPKQATGTVTVNVTGQSDGPPVVYDDSETTPEDTTLNASVPPATDPDGEPVTYAVVTGITGLTFNANGSYSYAPASNAHGTVSFTYKASDGIFDSNVATVTIIVTPVNDAPAAVADSYSTAEDTPLSVTAASGVLANDSDIESSPLSAVLEFGPDHGTLTLNANGSLGYTPAANYNGSDSFTYRASDGNLTSNVATVTVTVTAVNDAPVAQDDAKSTAEDTVLNSSVPAASEADGQTVSYALVAGIPGLTFNANGSYTYAPPSNFNGIVSFTYKASDTTPSDSNVATVTITVTPVNDAPVAVNDTYTVAEDGSVTIATPGVLGNDTDVDGSTLTAALGTGPADGALTLNANGSFAYTPDANFSGSDSFTYTAADSGATSNLATVTITVTPVADAPVAANDSATTAEDTAVDIDVLANDTDADGNTLAVTAVTDGAGGTVAIVGGKPRYTPGTDFQGTDTFTYTVGDGTGGSATGNVTVTVNNVAPSATFNAPASANEGSAIPVSLSNVVDPGTTDTHQFRFKCGAADWTAYSAGASHPCATTDDGTVVVKGQVKDDDGGESAEYSASVTVNNVAPSATFNAPPSVTEGSSIGLSLSGIVDPGSADTHEYSFSCDGGTTWTAWSSSPSHACATSDDGTRSVKGQVRDDDGSMSAEYSASVTVNNAVPSATFNTPPSVNEGSPIDISLSAVVDPGTTDTHQYRFSCDNGINWTAYGTSASHSCGTTDNGTRNVKGQVRDDDLAESGEYSAAVAVNNVAPSATFNAPASVTEGSSIALSLSGVVDPGSADTYEYRFSCDNGTNWTAYGGSTTHSCGTTDNGTRSVKGQARDDDLAESGEYSASVTVNNAAPSATFNAPPSVNEGSPISISLSAVADPGADTHQYRFSCDGGTNWTAYGSGTSHSCGTTDNGTRSVKGQVRDDDLAESGEYSASVTVSNVAPSATFNAPPSVDEGSPISISLSAIVDPGADTHEYSFSCDNGTTWTDWSSTANHACATTDNGTRSVKGQVRDDDGSMSAEYSASVTVSNVAPSATFNAPPSVDEGSPISISLSAVVDPGADTHQYRFSCDGGTNWTAYGSGTSHSCATTDNGTQSVKGQVRDDDLGESAEYSASVTVSNVAPSATFNAPPSVDEGSPISISLSAVVDPGADTHQYRFSCDGGTNWTAYGTSASHSCGTTDNGTRSVKGQVRDDDLGESAEYSAAVAVNNVAPSATFTAPASVTEGANINISLSAIVDPGADTHQYRFSCDNGTTWTAYGSGTTHSCGTTDNGTRNVKGQVRDDDLGESAEYSAAVAMNNAVPSATFNAPPSVNEGSPINLSLSAVVDPGSADTHQYRFSCDGGTNWTAYGSGTSHSCGTTDNGTRNVKGQVRDDDLGESAEYSAAVAVNNVAPSATFTAPASVTEGSSIALSLSDVVDPGSADTYQYRFSCDGGTNWTAYGSGTSHSCGTTDDGTSNVKGQVRDDDLGESAEYSAAVAVNNVAPSATFTAPASVDEGANINISLSAVVDPGADTHQYRFSCDNGTNWTAYGSGTSHSCGTTDDGTSNVKGQVRDDDLGESAEYSAAVAVNNVAPSATFTAPASVVEGSSINISLSAVVDPGTDTHEYRFSCNNGTTWTDWSSTANHACGTTDNGTRNVKGQVRDDDLSASAEYSAAVAVNNVAPSATFTAPASVTEGASISLSLSGVVDPGTADTYEYRFSCDNGTTWTDWSATANHACATTDNGSKSVKGQVRDDDLGESAEYSASVAVNNVAPSATFTAPASVDEGSPINISLSAVVDPGSADTYQYRFSCDNGTNWTAYGSSTSHSCGTTDNGTRSVKGQVRDDDLGESAEYSAAVAVNNVAPSATFTAPASVDESSAITISLSSASDASSVDAAAGFEYRFSCDNGTTWTDWSATTSEACATSDNGTKLVKGETRDKDGGTSSYSASVAVTNVAPSATFNAPASIDEGSAIGISLSAVVDPGADTYQYRFSCDNGATWTDWTTTASHACTTSDNGTRDVKGQVRDDDGGASAEYAAAVTVGNVAPSATFTAPASVNEGANINLSLSGVVDPGSADTHEYSFSCDGGTTWTPYGGSASHACATADNGTRSVKGQVRDDDGGTSAEYSASVTVDNVAPSGTFNAPSSVDEGSNVSVSLSNVVDPGSADTHEYRFSCDGTTWTLWSSTASHACATVDNGTSNVKGQVRDDDGAMSAEYTASVTVTNVAPSATFNAPASVDEGSAINVSLSSASDPSLIDTATGFEYRFSCDNGTTWTDWSLTASHACETNDNGTKLVKGEIRDKDGGTRTYSASVTVANVAPSATFSAPASVNEGASINLSLSAVVDPGSADTHQYRFSCDNGTTWTDWTATASHACATSDNGTRNVKGQVSDDDGGTSAEYAAAVTVSNVAPSATFTAPASVNEGSPIGVSLGSASDPSSVDTAAGFEYRFSCDNGTTWTDWSATASDACATTDNGTRSVKGEIRDKDGGTATYTASVAVANVAPSATFNAPASVSGDADIEISLSNVVDPGSADTHEYRFKCGTDAWTVYGAGASHTCATTGSGTVVVKGQVRDDDGGESVEYSASVVVDNVAPSATFTAPAAVDEGSPIAISLSDVVDPDAADTHQYRFRCGTGEWTAYGTSTSHSCATSDNGSVVVNGQVRDSNGAESSQYSATVTVANVAPSATFTAPASVNEGSPINISLSAVVDPGSADTHQYRFSCDNGTNWTAYGSGTSHSCGTTDNGTRNVKGQVRDDDLGESAEYSAAVAVNNVAPSSTFNAPPSVNEGSPINISLSAVVDPGSADTHQYRFSCDNGVNWTAYGTSASHSCGTTDNGTRNVKGQVRDDDLGESAEYSAAVAVNNVAPSATFTAPASVDEGSPINISLSAVVDPGADTHQYRFSCDGGTIWTDWNATANHACATTDNGSKSVKGQVRDDDLSESAEYAATVTVSNVAPSATFTAPASVNEGSNISVSLSGVVDSGADTHQYRFSCDNGATWTDWSSTSGHACATTDNGSKSVKGRVRDDDLGESAEYSAAVAVNNVTPSATFNAPSSVSEGSNISVSLSGVVDPGSADTHQYRFKCGAGDWTAYSDSAGSCATTDNGTVVVKGQVRDDDGGESIEYSASVAVDNATPSATFNAPPSVNEGSPINISLSAVVDPGTTDTHQYRFSCDNGVNWTAYGTITSHSCGTTDNGTSNVKGQLRDDDLGESSEYSAAVTVSNVDPSATFTAPAAVDEGSPIAISLSAVVDPGADTHQYRFSCDNGANWTAYGASTSHACATSDNGTRSVKGQVRDDDGGTSAEYAFSVTVDNLAPSATFNAPASVNEGASISVSLSAVVDAGAADTHEYRFKCGAGDWTAYGNNAGHSCATSDNGAFVVKGQVRDDDGGESGEYSATVTVNNVAPSATFTTPASVSEGASITLALSAVVDSGSADTHQYRFSCDNGANWTTYGTSTSHACATSDNGTRNVKGQVSDDDGESAEYSASVTVENVAPSATFTAPESVNEGSTITISLTSASDPSSVDSAAGFEYRFSCDNGTTWTDWGATASHSCPTSDNGSELVRGEIRDKDTGTSSYAASVAVTNVAPSATFTTPASVDEGSAITISLSSASDPSSVDTTAGFEYRFSCDNGTNWTEWGSTASHACATSDNGTKLVKGEIRDKDGGTQSYAASVAVTNVAPSATFNAPATVNEGASINVSLATVVDPGSADTHEYRFSCDNGTNWTDWSSTASHVCATTDNGTRSVKGQVRDDDGAASAEYSASVTVTNVAPSATFIAPTSVNEGASINLSLSAVVDPGSADTHQYRFSCDNGTNWTAYGNSANHACATTDNGTRNVKGQVRDDDLGESTEYSASVAVDNVSASAAFNAPPAVDEGANISISLSSLVDPGSADTHQYRFQCGAGDWTAYGATSGHSCGTSDNGTVLVKGQVRDDDGGESAEYSATVTVNNAPPSATFSAPASVDEGSAITVSLSSASDPSSVDTAAGFEYRFSCDNGTTWTDWGATASHSCPTSDNGTKLVKGEIRDKDGGTSTYSASVAVTNVAPAATFNAPAAVAEGADIDLSLSNVVDPGSADTHQYRFSCDNGITWTAYGNSATHACPTTDNGTRNINGQVRDDDSGASAEHSAAVTVNNVAPSAIFTAPGSVSEGSAIAISLSSASDPSSADTAAGFEYRFSCDDGTTWTTLGSTASHACPTSDNGTKLVRGEIRDKDGDISSYSASAAVTNVVPSATFNAPSSVNEGSPINISLTDVVDPGSVDTHQYSFSCDNGTTWTAWGSTASHACATGDNGTRSVKGQVRDDDGGTSGEYAASVTVTNVAPSATFTAPASVDEGSAINLSLTSASDPSSVDTTAGFDYRFSCDNGTTWTDWSSTGSHACPTSDNGTKLVKGEIRDKDGGTASYSASVAVTNVTPSATFTAPASVDEGASINLSLSAVVDPGSADTHQYRFSCDNGANWTTYGASANHACATIDNGTRNVKGQVRDDDGGESVEYAASVTVDNVAPAATFTAPASVDEGASINLSLSAVDSGSADTHAYRFSCDNGANWTTYGASASHACGTTDNGTRSVKGQVRDDDGGESVEYSATVTVTNVAPSATFNAPASVDEGSDIEISLTNVVDAGSGDTHQYRFKCGADAWTLYGAGASHTCAATGGSVVVKGQVRDDDLGESVEYSATVTVNNVAPSATFNTPAAVDEGSPIAVSLSDVVDPDASDTHEYRFSCDNGTTWTTYSNTASHSCTTSENGTRTVKGQVRDNNGGESSQYSATVTITNVAPSATFVAPTSVNEGSPINLSLASVVDPGSADTHQYRFSCDNGANWTTYGASANHACATTENGTRNVKGQVRDDDGGESSEYAASVSVDNVAPSATFTAPASVNEGASIGISLAGVVDPGSADTHQYRFSCDNGINWTAYGDSASHACATTDNGTRNVKGQVRDDDGGTSVEYTAAVTVNNVAPSATFNAPAAVDEGAPINISLANVVDPGSADTHQYRFSCDNGTSWTTYGNTASHACPTSDNGTKNVKGQVSDDDGGTSSEYSAAVTVNNLAPSATFTAPGSVTEGANINLSLSGVADQGTADTHEYRFSCDNGATWTDWSSTASHGCATTDNGSKSVKGQVRDDDLSESPEYATTVTVSNVAPSATFTAPASVNEGSNINISLSAVVDPGSADTHAYRFSCDGGTTWTPYGSGASHLCGTTDNGTRSVKGQVRDDDLGESAEYSATVAVNNATPSATFNAPASVDEGSPINISLSAVVDPGADTHQYRFSCDGGATWTAYGTSASHACATTDNGTRSVKGQVRDNDGGESTEYSASVTVSNVAPAATFNAPESADEGSPIAVSLTSASDQSSVDTAAGFAYRFSCDDGTTWTDWSSTASHACATTDNGTKLVKGEIRDKDVGVSSYISSVTVNNVAPSATFNAPASVEEGSSINLSLSAVVDSGSADTHQYRFSCDGGSTWTGYGNAASHACVTSNNGARTVKGQVRDDDGGASSEYSASVTVNNVAPSATFNAPASVNEGASINLSLTAVVDPGAGDTHQYRFSCDNGSSWTAWGAATTHTCASTDNGTKSVGSEIRDNDGGVSSYSASVAVNNVAPSATFTAPASASGGSEFEISLSNVVDPGSADTHQYRFKCGTDTWTVYGAGASHTCTAPGGSGSVVVKGQVRDDDGGESVEYSATVSVNNVAPSATFTAPTSVTEGANINISLSEVVDPDGADTHEYRFKCGAGEWTAYGTSSSHACATSDDGSILVKGQVRDSNGGESSEYSATVTVMNVAPAATFTAPASVNEGSSITISLANVVDPGSADTHAYRFKCGAGDWTAYGSTAGHSCATTDNGIVIVKGQVRDDDGGESAEYAASVTVSNVAPSATFNAPASVTEGANINLSLTAVVDPGSADTHQYRFSCDNGTTWTDWSATASDACATSDNGTRNVKGQVRDDDDGTSVEYSASVTVNNVAPSAIFNAPASVDEGSAIDISLNSPTDPSSVDTAAGFEYRFSCDNGTTWTLWSSTVSHACPTSDDGTKLVRGEIRDKDADARNYAASIAVTNVAPSATLNAPASVDEGSSINISLSAVVDSGSSDTHQYRFSCDNGATWTTYGASASHACVTSDNGARTVKGQVRDDDGGTSGEYSASVTVNNVAPSATFNAPASVNEGASINLSLTAVVDPGSADTHQYRFSCDNGTTWTAWSATASHACATSDNGTRLVGGEIHDNDGGTSSYGASVAVNNVAPSATFNAPASVSGGAEIEISLSNVVDSGSADTHQYRFKCGTAEWTAYGAGASHTCTAPGGSGSVVVKGQVRDDDSGESVEYSATVSVNNVAPSATFNAPATVAEGSPIIVSLSDVVDPDGADTHQYRFKCGTGEWTAYGNSTGHSCATSDNGSIVVNGQVRDSNGGESSEYSATVSVTNVAASGTFNAPATVNESSPINISLSAVVDPGSADTHEYRFSCNNGTTWTAYGNDASHACATSDNGTRAVKGQVSDDDGGTSAEYSASVTVNNVAPSATFNAPASVNEGSAINISLSSPSDPSSVDTGAGFEYRFSCDDGTTWTDWGASASHACATTDSGTRSVNGQIRDKDGGTSTYTASVTVTDVNGAPVAVDDPASTPEDTPVSVAVLANDTDAEGDTLTIGSFSQPANGAVTQVANELRYAPRANYHGPDSFTYTISDGNGGSDTATVTITVTSVNDAPVAVGQNAPVPEDTPTAIVLNASDVESASLSYSVVVGPSHGALSGSAPNLTYTPAANYSGADAFTFRASDGTENSNVATVTITVNAVNDAPVALDDAFTVEHNGTLNQGAPGVLGNDFDVESGLTAALVANPSSGTLILNSNGSFAYTPNAGFSGTDSFTYRANDGTLASSVATVTIAVGQAPPLPPPPPPPVADEQPPTDPLVQIKSHKPGTASSDRTIEVTWSGATDSQSGVDGFSFHWDNRADSVPDTIKDAEESVTSATSPTLSNGSWYFHLRTRDNAGNWSSARHFGPFMIAVRAPQQVRCVVPNLKGKTLAQARALLVNRHCALGRVTRAYSRLGAIRRIISQSRRPGARLPRGTKVNVVVSRGRRR